MHLHECDLVQHNSNAQLIQYAIQSDTIYIQ